MSEHWFDADPENGYQDAEFETAEGFLSALNPAAEPWSPNPRRWLFRGHADSAWKLIPSAHREDLKPWDLFPQFRLHASRGDHSRAELELWVEVGHSIDFAGLEIPGDSQALRHAHTQAQLFRDDWPPIDLLPALAILQHYGAPTRLLDWCRSARIAAYFAARDRAQAELSLELSHARTAAPSVSVWALDLEFIRAKWPASDRPPALTVVTVPYVSNPNVHAQTGAFTVYRGQPSSLDVIINEKLGDSRAKPHPLKKLSLPASETRRLMRLLAWEGTSAATVFPGYRGAIERVAEERLWDPKPWTR